MTEISERARAIAAEVLRRADWISDTMPTDAATEMAEHAAQLALDGWEPVDPDLEAAREIAAKAFEAENLPGSAAGIRAGESDHTRTVKAALAAYKAGRLKGPPG